MESEEGSFFIVRPPSRWAEIPQQYWFCKFSKKATLLVIYSIIPIIKQNLTEATWLGQHAPKQLFKTVC